MPQERPKDDDRLDRIERLLTRLYRRVRRIDGRVRTIESRPPPHIHIHTGEAAKGDAQDEWHSDDFRQVRWYGRDFKFSTAQSLVVRRLWEATAAGEPDVGMAELLEAAESDSGRLDNLFRDGQGRVHPAWEFLIVRSRKGFFRLERPAS
jgi:hypothetical protein